jgi:FlaG/FlaF family flagellin (archaellin)
MIGDRAVSPVFGYVLTLGITAILIVGLLTATSGYVDNERKQVGESELQVLGQQLSQDIASADRLSRTDGAVDASVSRNMQSRVVGSTYQVHVQSGTNGPTDPYLELTATELDTTVTVGLTAKRPVQETTISGGDIVVEYDGTALVIRSA